MRKIKKTEEIAENIIQTVMEPSEEKEVERGFFPTGSTTLNLACSDNPLYGYGKGKIVNIIGDSSAGKTFLALTCFAEMAQNNKFNDYRFIFDDAEAALEFDIPKLFGQKTADRIEDFTSDTIEDFYGGILRAIKDGRPFVYILDSFDAMTSEEEQERANEYAQNKENISGSFKTEKARMASEILRVIARDINRTNSLVIIISQTRDKIGVTFGSKKTRSGGKALKFYSCHEIWLVVEKLEIKKGREIGVHVLTKISKNKLTGKKRKVEYPILYEIGIDNLASCINFLIKEEHWEKRGNTINAIEFKVEYTKQKLIDYIEKNNLENVLYTLVGNKWKEIEDSLLLNRKKKYE